MTTIHASLTHDAEGNPVVVTDDSRGDAGQTDWDYLESMTEEEILQNARDDPDNPPTTSEQRLRMRIQAEYRAIRQSLGLTTEEFADRFQINLDTLQDWERGRRNANHVARVLLYVIGKDPQLAAHAAEETRLPAATAAD